MSGGGGGFFPSHPSRYHKLVAQAMEDADQQRLDADVNEYLQDLLAAVNTRDTEKIQERLAEIAGLLGEEIQLEQFLFGGSVAKQTYVDGLSDIDALAVLDRKDLAGRSPRAVLNAFHRTLQDRLLADRVESVAKGRLAVTVTYRDGTQIQLLPALRVASRVAIPSTDPSGWNETNPKAFQRLLTSANRRLNGCLVPAIKLVKSISSGLPKQKQLTGYHVECLAVDAAKDYQGAKTAKAVLIHVLAHASRRVLQPIRDVTGQARTVDSYLGRANNPRRRVAADGLAGVARRLNAATSVDQWKAVLED